MARILLIVLGICVFVKLAYAERLDWQIIGGEIRNLTAIRVDYDSPNILYAGTEKGLLRSEDSGNSWRNCFFVKGENKSVNFIVFDPEDHNILYAGTGNGLYTSFDKGKNWMKIFKGKNYLENICMDMIKIKDNFYLGTKAGLFVSCDNAKTWHRQKVGSSDSRIISIVKAKAFIFIACDEGVFKNTQSPGSWEKIFFNTLSQNDIQADEMQVEPDNEGKRENLRSLLVNNDVLYLACSKGIYKSVSLEGRWDLVTDFGIFETGVKVLFNKNEEEILAVTKSRVFEFDSQRWKELTEGLTVNEIRGVDIDLEGSIYVAADSGLYRTTGKSSLGDNSYFEELSLESQFPSIKDVKRAAIRYADAEPEKITNWRNQAQKKGLLPKVNVGVNNSTSDLWHWETGSTTKSGDDMLLKGKNSYEWDISLTWDLSELIWTDTQTSIDVRSRLMVELRNDLLDEVTKLYFERMRLCHELSNKYAIGNSKIIEKKIKLRELNAMLDSLTDGYFSEQINNFNKVKEKTTGSIVKRQK